MSWSDHQEAALKAIRQWLDDPNAKQVFRMFGYAGTGKTTLAKEFLGPGTSFAAFTGKAAHVLASKGCTPASTVHSLIYHSRDKAKSHLIELENELLELRREITGPDEDGFMDPRIEEIVGRIKREKIALSQPSFALNQDSPLRDLDLLVLDECSMIDGRLGEDLTSFETKILVLGDPAQLPPVKGSGYFTEGFEPDVMLTEIHRQARDNPILRLATDVRQGKALELCDHGLARVILKNDLDPQEPMDADQMIVGKNITRKTYNARMRERLGHTDNMPVPGDKLVCLRNNAEAGLLNGQLWFVQDTGGLEGDRFYMRITDGPDLKGEGLDVEAHAQYFLGTEEALPWWERKEAEEFDYGYALTCHKSQGSQWDHVLLFDESYCFRADKNKWLYTAITRAAERLTVVRT